MERKGVHYGYLKKTCVYSSTLKSGEAVIVFHWTITTNIFLANSQVQCCNHTFCQRWRHVMWCAVTKYNLFALNLNEKWQFRCTICSIFYFVNYAWLHLMKLGLVSLSWYLWSCLKYIPRHTQKKKKKNMWLHGKRH